VIAVSASMRFDWNTKAVFPHDAEDQLKKAFFGDARTGFFVEVGANDPQQMSQTWHLEQLGWTGILIEPQPALAEELRRRRRAKVFAVACSSPQLSGRTVPLHLSDIHSSLNPHFFVAGAHTTGVIEVPLRTLDEILSEAQAPIPIDFLSIDVESHEIDVIAGLDLAKWRPRLILIEDLAMDLRLHRLLVSRGYKWVRRTGLNAWYVPDDFPMSVGLFGQFQFFRKHVLAVPFRHLRETKRRYRQRLKDWLAGTDIPGAK
jgi:FkbM family methyltransferase